MTEREIATRLYEQAFQNEVNEVGFLEHRVRKAVKDIMTYSDEEPFTGWAAGDV